MRRAVALLLVFASCSRASSPSGEPAEAASSPPAPATVAEVEAAYANGRSVGDARFANRTLLLTGYVASIDDDQGRTIVWIGPDASDAKHGYQDTPDPGFRCPLGGGGPIVPDQKVKAAALKISAKVTIECKAGTASSRDIMGQTVYSPTFCNCTL